MMDNKTLFKRTVYLLSKLFFLAFFIYREVLANKLFNGNSTVMWGMLLCAIVFNFVAVGFKWIVNAEYVYFWLFILFSLASGLYIAIDTEQVRIWGMSFIVSLVSLYLIISFSITDNNINSSITFFLITAISAVMVTWVSGGINLLRISISENSNTNTLGVMMLFAIAMVLYRIETTERKAMKIVPLTVLALVFAYFLISTASKKAILGTILLLLLWMVFCLPKQFKGLNLAKWLFAVSVVAIVLSIFYIWFMKNNFERYQYVLNRMITIREDESTKERSALIEDAWNIFLQHPIIGVGLNNFRYYTSLATYSHSTYFELLSCTGIIGTALFLLPIIRIFINIYKKRKFYKSRDEAVFIQTNYMLMLYIIILFILISQIAIYDFIHMYLLVTASAFSRLNNPMAQKRIIRISI